jgi:hypothetical protein
MRNVGQYRASSAGIGGQRVHRVTAITLADIFGGDFDAR